MLEGIESRICFYSEKEGESRKGRGRKEGGERKK